MKNNLFVFVSTIFLTVNAQDYSTQISCNFDSDWCNFTPNVYFTRYTGVSPSITSGPTEDRTGDGFYALCNGKLLLDPNEKCLFYQNVSLLVDTDLKFWYHMSGVHIGTLEVILNETNVVWSLTGKQKNEWIQAEITLPAGDYSLAFSANRSIYGRSSCDIALDDLNLKGQPLTTQLVTVTRTTAVPTMNISSDFDTLDDLNGWHTLFDKNNWIQADGVSNVILGYYGPGSDWSSINTGLKNITFTNRPLNTSCSIPYSFSVYPDKIEFYCKKVSIYQRNNLVCGLNKYPSLSYKQEIALCTQGNYLMITSDKFDSGIGSYRSRLYSPVFKLAPSQDKFCLSFKYNILTASNDGFRVYVENYLFQSEYKLVFDKRGPLVEDRWYSAEVPVTNVSFEQIIIFFEPIRGENRDTQSSVSIDSVNLEYRECDPALVDSTTSNTQYFTTVQSTLGSKDTNTYEVSNFLNLTSHKTITTQNLIETSSKFEYSSSQKHELTSPVQSTLNDKETFSHDKSTSNLLNLTSHKTITTQNLIETSSKFEYSSSQKHELTSPVQSTLNDKETFSHDKSTSNLLNLTSHKTITTQNLIKTSSKFDYFSSQKNDLTTTKQMVMSVENDATTYFEKQTYIDNSSQMTSPQTEQLDSTDENSYTAIYVTVAVISSIIIIVSGGFIFKKYIFKYTKKDKLEKKDIEMF